MLLHETSKRKTQTKYLRKKIPVKDIMTTIKFLNGQDDIGIEDFIQSFKKAEIQCFQLNLLSDFIIAEKIQGNAERARRNSSVHGYDDLYKTLRKTLKQIVSLSALRSKLESCKRGITETTENFNLRFRQVVN